MGARAGRSPAGGPFARRAVARRTQEPFSAVSRRVIRSLASDPAEAAEGADRRKALFKASLAAIETDPRKRTHIDRTAAEAGITDRDETVGAHDCAQNPRLDGLPS